ncbi:hypothetical protein ABR737_37340 [Streptomyces sp. Edi2]|uniref:hypothetical protein n=1 Tax=Streptomyces sp. Edi2 TaxID=3162528 RepID=UPI003305FC4C
MSAAALLFADVVLIVVLARLCGALAMRLAQPAVVGEIVAGILLGPTLLHGELARTLIPTEVRPALGALAGIGVAGDTTRASPWGSSCSSPWRYRSPRSRCWPGS